MIIQQVTKLMERPMKYPFKYSSKYLLKYLGKRWIMCLIVAWAGCSQASEDEHNDHEGEDDGVIELLAEAQRSAGIVVTAVALRALTETLQVPGEVVINAYQSVRVSPRITAQVVARHVRLGDEVEVGRRLVTLSSVVMAEAQGALLVSNIEWQRVKRLGRATVSERRYTEAQVAHQQSLAKVLAYGMTKSQANALMKSADASNAIGAFDLFAPLAGTVLQDDFIVGELIEPGRVLIDITDESSMWVEAQTVPNSLTVFGEGTRARVSLDQITWLEGTVIQRHHRLDEVTRTQGLRIEVDNTDDRLHPGQFVVAEIVTGASAPTLAVPVSAITLIEGVPTVFTVKENHEFYPQRIDVGATVGDWVIVRAGLSVGDQIVVKGLFYLKSLLLKSSLGEGHAH